MCNPPLTPTLGGSGGHSEEAQDAQPFASSDLCSLETVVRSSGEESSGIVYSFSCFLWGLLQRPSSVLQTVEPSQKSGETARRSENVLSSVC